MGNYHVRFCSRAAGATSPLRHLHAETRLSGMPGGQACLRGASPPGHQLLCDRRILHANTVRLNA
jgi:hypothetical protein